MGNSRIVGIAGVAWALVIAACSGGGDGIESTAESCMTCHNGSPHDDYAGPGLQNPHPFPGADELRCTTCHGGNPKGGNQLASHVPPPPEIGDDENLETDHHAYFNRLTLTGIDKFPDYTVGGKTYSALDYLQFINPGDLRVVTEGKACGKCHQGHAECVQGSLLATSAGIFSGASFAVGVDNKVAESVGLWEDTAADMSFREVQDSDWTVTGAPVGSVTRLVEFPVYAERFGPMHDNDTKGNYAAAGLADDVNPDNSFVTDSPLAELYHEQVAFTCGDCHLGSAGANNRYGDFRSSGCTACHMPYGLDGRTDSRDPNLNKYEPADPDDIDAPERAHVRQHRILSTARTNAKGAVVPGIDDYACAGCHQGSNRTVMQYWGIRLDQNADLAKGHQYPAQPAGGFVKSFGDERLFDPEVKNKTFNGRNGNQYIVKEDYDDDGRDDTPVDVHYYAGMGCIDCHGSYDLHGGDVDDPDEAYLQSRMHQGVAIRCESCHGGVDAYAQTIPWTDDDGAPIEVAVDEAGKPLPHVRKESDGHFYLYSKLTGDRHYVSQTLDTTVDNGRTNPLTGKKIYTPRASYAMGRDDGASGTGIGPQQSGSPHSGFSHMDNLSCAACHSSWTNTCMGCHLVGEFNGGNNFSNVTGERIVFREREAQFVYQSPVPFQLGVGPDGKIGVIAPNTEVFFQYRDFQGQFSDIFAASDRNGSGNDPARAHPSLSANVMLQHSIRGRVTNANEGARQCVACHMTEEGLANFETEYDTFRTAMANGDWGSLDFDLIRDHIGLNPGNQINSPLWAHMVSGLGSGLFLFDENGGAMNPLDENEDRYGSNDVAPADQFDPAKVVFNLDRIVEPDGTSNGSSNHVFLDPGQGPALRDGSGDPEFAGPLGATLIRKLADPDLGVVLDSWIDANGDPGGDASNWVGGGN